MTGINQGKMKLRFDAAEGKLSRRELLTLGWLRYEEMPYIEAGRCRGYEECGLCVAGCPLKAVAVDGDGVTIDTTLCSGCGACVEVCPFRAIIYPHFSLEELDNELERLSVQKDTALQPGVVAVFCQRCLPGSQYQGITPLYVPCLAMVSPWLILRAFDRGAQGVAVISGGSECRAGYDHAHLKDNIRFVQNLFSVWGIETERVRIFDVTKGGIDSIEGELSEFAREIASLGPTPLSMSQPTPVPDDGLRLPSLVKGMNDKLRSSSAGEVAAGAVPFGRVELDGSRCTGCGLCALDCPTGALAVSSSEETDAYKLLFKHDACLACGRCVEVCPEKCLVLERILELDRLGAPADVIFSDVIVLCAGCDEPVGSRSMINNVKAKLIAAGQSLSAEFELCPECKVKAQFQSWEEEVKPLSAEDKDDGYSS